MEFGPHHGVQEGLLSETVLPGSETYSFTITHAKVIVEDCVSRCPSHLPEPTQEELDMEKDWELDPPPHLDLEKLAAQSAKLQVRPERICHLEEEQICMNIMFGTNKV